MDPLPSDGRSSARKKSFSDELFWVSNNREIYMRSTSLFVFQAVVYAAQPRVYDDWKLIGPYFLDAFSRRGANRISSGPRRTRNQ
jgi:hypothetical protein